MSDNTRTEVLRNGEWVECDFSQLTDGDTFRRYVDGNLCCDYEGESENVAIGNAYLNDEDVWEIVIE